MTSQVRHSFSENLSRLSFDKLLHTRIMEAQYETDCFFHSLVSQSTVPETRSLWPGVRHVRRTPRCIAIVR